jgi:hypothetical protein
VIIELHREEYNSSRFDDRTWAGFIDISSRIAFKKYHGDHGNNKYLAQHGKQS